MVPLRHAIALAVYKADPAVRLIDPAGSKEIAKKIIREEDRQAMKDISKLIAKALIAASSSDRLALAMGTSMLQSSKDIMMDAISKEEENESKY